MADFSQKLVMSQLKSLAEEGGVTDVADHSHIKAYFDFYGFPATADYTARYKIGYIGVHFKRSPQTTTRIACQLYYPEQPKQLILICHGYLDHSGTYGPLVDELLQQGYAVVMYDLPGHGLSEGKGADIDCFSCYDQVLEEVLSYLKKHEQLPHSIIAHSTGCAALIKGLLITRSYSKTLFKTNIILTAPLVRIANWNKVRFLHFLLRYWLRRVSTGKIDNSHDHTFIEKLYKDPLRYHAMPLKWLRAAFAYEKTIDTAGICPSNLRVSVIQGTLDNTVDWRHNVELLKQRIPCIKPYYIPGAKHHVLNEAEPMKSQAKEVLLKCLLR